MNSIKDILVIVDPTASDQPAVAKAAVLAAQFKASIELVVCETQHARKVSPKSSPLRLHTWLESLAASLRVQGITVRTSTIAGDPLYATLLNWIHNSPADLVIKDTHHHSAVKRTPLGNTDWHLIRECRLPLLLTKPTLWHERPAIAAAIDPHATRRRSALLDRRILECAVQFAGAIKATVHAIHVILPAILTALSDSRVPRTSSTAPQILAAMAAVRREGIKTLVAPYDILNGRLHVEIGTPAESLPQLAQEHQIDIIVMGSISKIHAKQALIGSTAERALERLPCDILMIKETDFGESLPF